MSTAYSASEVELTRDCWLREELYFPAAMQRSFSVLCSRYILVAFAELCPVLCLSPSADVLYSLFLLLYLARQV